MAYTRKQVVTCCSIIYLILVTALASYAVVYSTRLSIPISRGLSYATTFLPMVSGILLELGFDLTRRQEGRKRLAYGEVPRPPLVIVANTLIFIYSSVVISLLGTHVAPSSSLDCGLREHWTTLFSRKDGEVLKRIQDAFQCCGLKNTKDMSWPFQDKTHAANTCASIFGRVRGCLDSWKSEEQRLAGILMATVGLVALWQLAIIVVPTERESWLHSVVPDRISRIIADERHGTSGPRRAIDYLPNFNQYSDNAEDRDGQEARSGARQTLENGVRRVGDVRLSGSVEDDGEHVPAENEWMRT